MKLLTSPRHSALRLSTARHSNPYTSSPRHSIFGSTILLLSILFLTSCKDNTTSPATANNVPLSGTWQLLSATTITKGVAAVTDFSKDQRMIKLINNNHFCFLKHDINTPKDSSNNFDAGGGRYTLAGDQYTEHLDYYKDRNWEGKTFNFTVSINNDTLVQRGMEKVEAEGIEREIIEKYLRLKD